MLSAVVLSFLYCLARRALALVRVHRMDALAKDAEILVLRHQLVVLRRQVPRARFNGADRALVARLASLVPKERWRSFLVTPQTVLDWHRGLVRTALDLPHRRPGRPPLADGARRAHLPPNEGEPKLGLPTHRWRTEEAWHPRLERERCRCAPPAPPPSGVAAPGPSWPGAPPRPSGSHLGH